MAWAASSRHSLSRVLGGQLASAPARRTSVRQFAADHHGPPKINFWQDPMSPSKWKEEQFVLISLAGWGLFGYGVFKAFSGGSKAPPSPEAKANC